MTPATPLQLEFAAQTDIGRVRPQNEDALACSAAGGFALLADGMGGHLAGEVASGMAIAIVRQELEQALLRHSGAAVAWVRQQLPLWICDAFLLANSQILQAARSQAGCSGMGTTLVLALYFDNTLWVAHVGDSRLYRLRGDALQLLTRDHSLLQERLTAGLITPEQAALSKNRNLITRALGASAQLQVELHDYDVLPGDIALLCSDGLSDMLPQPQIAGANARGGRDNISVVLIKARDNAHRAA